MTSTTTAERVAICPDCGGDMKLHRKAVVHPRTGYRRDAVWYCDNAAGHDYPFQKLWPASAVEFRPASEPAADYRPEMHPLAVMDDPTPDTEHLSDTLPPEPEPDDDGWVSPLMRGIVQCVRLYDERMPACCDDGKTMEATR